MVTARQPAGFWPSLPPAAASQEPRRGLAMSYPLSTGIASFLPPGKWGENIRLDNGHFQKKVEAVGTGRNRKTAAQYKRNQGSGVSALGSGPGLPPYLLHSS